MYNPPGGCIIPSEMYNPPGGYMTPLEALMAAGTEAVAQQPPPELSKPRSRENDKHRLN